MEGAPSTLAVKTAVKIAVKIRTGVRVVVFLVEGHRALVLNPRQLHHAARDARALLVDAPSRRLEGPDLNVCAFALTLKGSFTPLKVRTLRYGLSSGP